MSALDNIEKLLNEQKGTPPLDKWHPELSGDIDIRIAADGRWFHEGGEIKRHELVCLFSSILRREDDGEYYLVTPVEKWRLTVDDLPLIIVDTEIEKEGTPNQRIAVKTNVDRWYVIDARHPLTVVEDAASSEPQPSVMTEYGLSARVNRASFYRMVEMARECNGKLILRSSGSDFELGKY